MALDMWFPTAVYTEDLSPTAATRYDMLNYVDYIADKYSEEYSLTGDVLNDYQIAGRPEFSWLNKEVTKHCYEYLKQYGLDINKFNLFSSKSWPVVCNPDKISGTDSVVIQRHNHMNSHVSVVFYLQTDTGKGGDLKLHISPTHPISYVPCIPYLKEVNYLSLNAIKYQPTGGQLIIFPSSVEHEVSLYYGSTKRYSITYDIIITGKEGADIDNEMCTINPKNWIDLTNG
tara:strand:- start:170 stop:859 length:690 start_codon:yes stop_codon:yes gene_type:complete